MKVLSGWQDAVVNVSDCRTVEPSDMDLGLGTLKYGTTPMPLGMDAVREPSEFDMELARWRREHGRASVPIKVYFKIGKAFGIERDALEPYEKLALEIVGDRPIRVATKAPKNPRVKRTRKVRLSIYDRDFIGPLSVQVAHWNLGTAIAESILYTPLINPGLVKFDLNTANEEQIVVILKDEQGNESAYSAYPIHYQWLRGARPGSKLYHTPDAKLLRESHAVRVTSIDLFRNQITPQEEPK